VTDLEKIMDAVETFLVAYRKRYGTSDHKTGIRSNAPMLEEAKALSAVFRDIRTQFHLPQETK
jgi:hypothetical protein